MFKLIATMRRGSASDLAAAWARYPTINAARLGIATLLRDGSGELSDQALANDSPLFLSHSEYGEHLP